MAVLTTANFDFLLIRMTGRKLAYAGLDATTVDGTNLDLLLGKLEGLRSLGFAPASPVAITNADLLAIADSSMPQLLDIARLVTLQNVLDNLADPDQTSDTDNTQAHGKFYDSLEKTVARLQKRAERAYGYGLGGIWAGVIDLGFQETLDQSTGFPN